MWCSDTVDLSTCTSASASSTFIPSSNPSGSPYLRVQVDAYYSDAAKATSNPEITATSAALPVLNGAAANAAPTLSCKKTGCSDLVGDTLVATAGTWSTHLRPITYTYQWERCFAQVDATHVDPASCYAIPNATKKQYTLGFDDVDYYVVADVTAVDSAGDTLTNVSNSTSMVNLPPAPTVKGTVKVTDLSRSSGNIQVGDSVQPSVTWVSPLPLVFTYQWVDCQSDGTNCAPVAGGSAGQVQTYTVARTDAGQQLAVQITATDPFSQTARTQSVSRRVQ
jgi:hypothetical protein